MRRLLLLAALVLPVSARALTSPRAGMHVTVEGGPHLRSSAPLRATPAWALGTHLWWGRYDDVYALGRFTSLGVTVRQRWVEGELRTVPSLEARHGMDVLVVGYHGFASIGPDVGSSGLGVEGLVGIGAKYRPKPHVGLGLRLGIGAGWQPGRPVDVRGVVQAQIEWSFPFSRHRRDG